MVGTYLFVHWGLKLVQLMKIERKHDRLACVAGGISRASALFW